MSKFFNKDSEFSKKVQKIIDIMTLSIIFVACSIPVITLGAAFTALIFAAGQGIKSKEEESWRYFMPAFKDNLKPATIIWGIMIIANAICGFYMWFWSKSDNALSSTMMVIGIVLCALIFMVYLYVFYLQSVKDRKSIIQIRNAFLYSIKYMPTTLVLALIMVVVTFLMLVHPVIFGIIFVLIGAGLTGYAFAYMYMKTFEDASNEDATQKVAVTDEQQQDEAEVAEEATTEITEEEQKDEKNQETAAELADISIMTDADEPEEEEKDDLLDAIDFDSDKEFVKKSKSISLTDADEDARNKIKEQKEAEERAVEEAKMKADLEAKQVASELASRVKDAVTYETAGENVYRRDTNITPAKRGVKPTKKQRKK